MPAACECKTDVCETQDKLGKSDGAVVCAYYDDLTPCLWRPAATALPSVPRTPCSNNKPTSSHARSCGPGLRSTANTTGRLPRPTCAHACPASGSQLLDRRCPPPLPRRAPPSHPPAAATCPTPFLHPCPRSMSARSRQRQRGRALVRLSAAPGRRRARARARARPAGRTCARPGT